MHSKVFLPRQVLPFLTEYRLDIIVQVLEVCFSHHPSLADGFVLSAPQLYVYSLRIAVVVFILPFLCPVQMLCLVRLNSTAKDRNTSLELQGAVSHRVKPSYRRKTVRLEVSAAYSNSDC